MYHDARSYECQKNKTLHSVHQPTNVPNKIQKRYKSQNAIHNKYQTPTCFDTGVPFSGSPLEQ